MKKVFLLVFVMSWGLTRTQTLTPDLSFDTDGKMTHEFYSAGVTPCILQGQQKYLVNSTIFPSPLPISQIKMFNADGSPDLNFGLNGTLDDTGKIRTFGDHIFLAKILWPNQNPPGSYYDFKISKLDILGQLDSSFGINGSLAINFGENEVLEDYLILPDGKLLCLIHKFSEPWHKAAIVRINTDGTIDTSFASTGFKEYYIDGQDTRPRTIHRNADGSLFIWCDNWLVNLDADGNIDTTFASAGKMYIGYASKAKVIDDSVWIVYNNSSITSATLMKKALDSSQFQTVLLPYTVTDICKNDDGTFYSYGYEICTTGIGCYNGVAIARHLATGAIDTQFDLDGTFEFNFGPTFVPSDCSSDKIYSEGSSVLIYGHVKVPSTIDNLYNTNHFSLARFNTTLSIPETATTAISVVPNPTTGVFTISKADGFFGFTEIEMFNILGQSVLHTTHPNPGAAIEINIEKLPQGIYILNVLGDNGIMHSQKVIRQ